ncbi:MAG: T6SS immunity protein Tdi1 domain-containing protein [Pseudoclavibacter sp.]
MATLDWDHLFVDAARLDMVRIVEPWTGLVHGPIRPIGMSMFGDVYFDRYDDVILRIDVLEGGVVPVADDREHFDRLMNTPEWARDALLVEGVALMHQRGIVPAEGECYAFAPHPVLTGTINWDHVMTMSAVVWHSICAQSVQANSRAS